MIKVKSIGILSGAFVIFATPSLSVTINEISGIWENTTPALGISGEGTSSIRWGNTIGFSEPSGYDFSGAAPPAIETEVSDPFIVGEFTHFNFPVSGISLQSAELLVSLAFSDGATAFSRFNFTHEETSNSLNPCPYGGANNTGINSNGCADRVEVALDVAESSSLEIDGENYFLDFQAFRFEGETVSSFVTAEQEENNAFILGALRTEDQIGAPSPIPLPASAWLLIAGVGGLAGVRRRSF